MFSLEWQQIGQPSLYVSSLLKWLFAIWQCRALGTQSCNAGSLSPVHIADQSVVFLHMQLVSGSWDKMLKVWSAIPGEGDADQSSEMPAKRKKSQEPSVPTRVSCCYGMQIQLRNTCRLCSVINVLFMKLFHWFIEKLSVSNIRCHWWHYRDTMKESRRCFGCQIKRWPLHPGITQFASGI